MEASALKYQAGIGLHAKTPLLRLQSDERLITLLRRGNTGAFEVLFARYETRLLSFCRHLLGSREDAEDVLQEVMTAAFHAIVADERPINVRPWLYRIARNRSLNHLRRTTAIASETMDLHFAENGTSTADKVHEREKFRLLVGDIQELPETQRTALVLREMDALSYEQIAEAMETTVSSVKSLLVRARMGLAEASEARQLTCEEVRLQLAEVAEGLIKKPDALVRRHMKGCKRCSEFRGQLKATNKALAALLPVGPLVVFKKLAVLHLGLGHSAGAGSGAGVGAAGGAASAGAGAASAGAGAALGSGVFAGGSMVSAGMGAVATKAAAGLAAAVIVTAGAVEVDHAGASHPAAPVASVAQHTPSPIAPVHSFGEKPSVAAVTHSHSRRTSARHSAVTHRSLQHHPATTATTATTTIVSTATTSTSTTASTPTVSAAPTTPTTPGRVQTQTDPTILPPTTSTPAPPITPTTPATTTTATGTTTTSTGTATTTTGTTTPMTTGTGTTTTGSGTTGTTTTTTGTGTTGTGTGTTTTGVPTTPSGATPTYSGTIPSLTRHAARRVARASSLTR